MPHLSVSDAIQLIIAICVVLPLLGVFLRWCFRVGKKINLILHQVTPNGGGSMNDRLLKVEGAQAVQGQELIDQTRRLQSIEHKLDSSIQNQKSRGYQ